MGSSLSLHRWTSQEGSKEKMVKRKVSEQGHLAWQEVGLEDNGIAGPGPGKLTGHQSSVLVGRGGQWQRSRMSASPISG